MRYGRKRYAFTMIELIFVIVVMGIVASIASSAIAQIYEAYLVQRSVHNGGLKTELAINQLGNRLTYRISQSLVARIPGQTAFGANNALPLQQITPSTPNLSQYQILEWIGYDNDGFSSQNPPAWSGFCDLNDTSTTFSGLVTVGSNLSDANTILSNIYGTAASPALYFLGITSYALNTTASYDYNTSCMYASSNNCLFPVSFASDTQLTFQTNTYRDSLANSLIYSEFYQIVASAYAVVPENSRQINGTTVFDLYLYYDYQPWQGENYTQGSKSLLVPQVSVFRFKQENGTIRLKICALERLGSVETMSICKEKAVIQ